MNRNLLLIGVTLFAFSCSSNKGEKNTEPVDGGQGIGIDTMTVNELERSMGEPSLPSSSSAVGGNDSEPDNMRGFDPASEEDMDDNGMSRYMENNDEEGWD